MNSTMQFKVVRFQSRLDILSHLIWVQSNYSKKMHVGDKNLEMGWTNRMYF